MSWISTLTLHDTAHPHDIAGLTSFYEQGGLGPFLAQVVTLLCLLPLTNLKRNILNKDLIDQLPMLAALVRGGWGVLQLDRAALIEGREKRRLLGPSNSSGRIWISS